jgi:hypothetical protein
MDRERPFRLVWRRKSKRMDACYVLIYENERAFMRTGFIEWTEDAQRLQLSPEEIAYALRRGDFVELRRPRAPLKEKRPRDNTLWSRRYEYE